VSSAESSIVLQGTVLYALPLPALALIVRMSLWPA